MRSNAVALICGALVLWQLMPDATATQSSTWTYATQADAMSGGTIKTARTRSTNTVSFGFPYGGPQRATLVLRSHPRYGLDVLLSVERGQFLCSFDGCAMLVRFDSEEASNWNAVEPADHSTTTLFIRESQAFIDRLLSAKTLRVAANFFQEGEPVFIFNVAGLVW